MFKVLWRRIPGFDDHEVSNTGRVQRTENGRDLTVSFNQHGIPNVALYKGTKQHRRSVPVLVAEAFLDRDPSRPVFDTPIQLDGDRGNCHVLNLMWRPRWFAMKFHHQFKTPPPYFNGPTEDITSGEVLPHTFDFCVKYGLLYMEIWQAAMNQVPVFPTWQEFRFIED